MIPFTPYILHRYLHTTYDDDMLYLRSEENFGTALNMRRTELGQFYIYLSRPCNTVRREEYPGARPTGYVIKFSVLKSITAVDLI